MQMLNYHHLYYFWIVVKEGSITAACQQLRVAQPTVSEQIKTLENSLGCKLFLRAGRRLTLTESGRLVYRHADEIFALGQDLVNTLKGYSPQVQRLRLNVGIANVMPKLLVFRLLEPATRIAEPVNIVCQEGNHLDLLTKLSFYELDILLTDTPIGSQAKIKAFNHLLGECGTSVFGAKNVAKKYQDRFPRSLHQAPFLFPLSNTALRRSLDNWFNNHNLQPALVGEFEDSALLKLFGQAGFGLFVMPTVEEREILAQYDVAVIGRLEDVKERFYAISTERKVKNPAVLAITAAAHSSIFE
jgi:LysR family transcriptional activator of nhaA